MAGRPRKKAKQIAAEAEPPPPEQAVAMADAAMQAAVEAAAAEHEANAASAATGSLRPAALQAERQDLSTWWREHIAEMEATLHERRKLLEFDTVHPSVIFAHQARTFGALGMPRDVAAVMLGLSDGEFIAHYDSEYTAGGAELFGQVAANFIRIATSGNDRYAVKACIEFLNRRGGEEWRAPAQKLQLEDNRPRGTLIDSSKLTYAERAQLRALILAAAREPVAALEGPEDDEGNAVESGQP